MKHMFLALVVASWVLAIYALVRGRLFERRFRRRFREITGRDLDDTR